MFFFEARGGFLVYMGKDKFENEKLIEYGWPEDVWFHVDDLSSAHVYLRLPRGPVRRQFLETGEWRGPCGCSSVAARALLP